MLRSAWAARSCGGPFARAITRARAPSVAAAAPARRTRTRTPTIRRPPGTAWSATPRAHFRHQPNALQMVRVWLQRRQTVTACGCVCLHVPACACVRACIPNRVCTWHASGSWDRGKHSMLHNTTHSRTQLWCACTAQTRLAWALVDWLAARHTGVIFKGKLPADQRPTTWLFLWVVLCASAMLSSLVYRTACGTCGSTRRERERGGGGAAGGGSG